MRFVGRPHRPLGDDSGDEDRERDERSNAPRELPEAWELLRPVRPLAWDLTSSASSRIGDSRQSAVLSLSLDEEICNLLRTALRVAEHADLNGKAGKLNIA
uniref:Uncharacterized protein n=1 Tax=Plectus sambesii TaxID=2011161 RepID=A0A914W5M8_9BILA